MVRLVAPGAEGLRVIVLVVLAVWVVAVLFVVVAGCRFQPPRVDELCDVNGEKLVIRNDDRLEVIQPRLTAYQEQTRPVADYYQRTGRLISVNGDLPMDDVTSQIFKVLEDHHA